LTIHCIPYGKSNADFPKSVPVLLLHDSDGLSDTWLSNVPSKNLPLILAETDHDVWMINYRGSVYSQKHVSLNPNQRRFWNFSRDQIAYYDLAAVIDYIINKTNKTHLIIVGHSFGGSLPFALLADRPEYNEKVRVIYSLAPIGNLAGISGTRVQASKILQLILELKKAIGIYKTSILPKIPKKLMGFFVKHFNLVFRMFISSTCGPVSDVWWNSTRSPNFATHAVGGTSILVVMQLIQQVLNPGFRHFDYGAKNNLRVYHQETAPDYDIGKVTVPTYLYYGVNDIIATKENMDFLKDNLGNAMELSIAGNQWNNVAYFIATDADLFYSQITKSILNNAYFL